MHCVVCIVRCVVCIVWCVVCIVRCIVIMPPPPQSGNTHLIIQYEYIGWTIDTMPDVMGFVQFVYDVAKRIDEASYTNNTILVHDT